MCNAGIAATPLESLLEAIRGFLEVPAPALTPAALGEHLIRLRHGIDLLELGFASDAASFAGTDEYDAQGSVSPIDWIRHHCHMTGHAAATAVASGAQLGRLPASVAALDSGDIGFAHFALLARTARALSATLGAAPVDVPLSGDASGVAARLIRPVSPCRPAPAPSTSAPSWSWRANTRLGASATTAAMPATPLTPPRSSPSR